MIDSQPLVDVGDGLTTVLPRGVAGDVLHRPGPVERDERDHVLELRRLHLAEGVAHARRLELEDARRVGPRQHLVRLAVVERDLADVDAVSDQPHGLVDHVEVAKPEEVHLEEAERLDVLHRELRHDLLVGALLLQRDDLDQRLGADHDAGRVDRVGPGQALERARELDDLTRDRVVLDGVRELPARLERLVERLSRPLRDQLRDAVDDPVGDLEHPAGVAHRGARRHRREGDDLRDAVAAVLLRHVVDDPLTSLDGEVEVHVRHVLARGVQEPLEQQAVAHRVDVRDLEAVRRERAGGAAAARADRDAVALREPDEVADDQEVVREPHLADRLELEAKPLVELRRRRPVPLDEPLLALVDQLVECVAPLGEREPGEQDPAELDLDVAPLRDLEAPAHRLLVPREVERHLGRRLEIELVRLEPPAVRVLQRVAGLDAEQRLVRVRIGGVEVVHVPRRHEWQATLRRELGERLQDRLLDVECPRSGARRRRCPARTAGRAGRALPRRPPDGSRRAHATRGPRGSRRARSARAHAARGAASRPAACSSTPRGSRGSRA